MLTKIKSLFWSYAVLLPHAFLTKMVKYKLLCRPFHSHATDVNFFFFVSLGHVNKLVVRGLQMADQREGPSSSQDIDQYQ